MTEQSQMMENGRGQPIALNRNRMTAEEYAKELTEGVNVFSRDNGLGVLTNQERELLIPLYKKVLEQYAKQEKTKLLEKIIGDYSESDYKKMSNGMGQFVIEELKTLKNG